MRSNKPQLISRLGRMPKHGNLRLGVKAGKAMKSISEWRITSPDKDAITRLAEMYGGEVRPWHDQKASPRDQFEVLTPATRLDVLLVPDGLDQAYELYGGQGIERRCTGAVAEVTVKGRDGRTTVEQECVCHANGRLECKLQTRLHVLFSGVPLGGYWEFKTKSDQAADELVAMTTFIYQMQEKEGGLIPVWLDVEQHNTPGHNFVLAKLRLKNTLDELVLGEARYGLALGAGGEATAKALGTGDEYEDDEEIVVVPPPAEEGDESDIEDAVIVEVPEDGTVNPLPMEFDGMSQAALHAQSHGGTVKRNSRPGGKKWVVE